MFYVDLLEIFGRNYFIVVDNYFCWFEVILLMKIDVVYVIKVMVGLFYIWFIFECL